MSARLQPLYPWQHVSSELVHDGWDACDIQYGISLIVTDRAERANQFDGVILMENDTVVNGRWRILSTTTSHGLESMLFTNISFCQDKGVSIFAVGR